PLQHNVDDGGYFVELSRLKDGAHTAFSTPVEVKQISLSQVIPNSVKAYHVHYKQDDVWFVAPHDKLLVNLHDIRKDSPTYDAHIRLVLGGGKATALRIPAGVAHGVGNPYNRSMHLIYTTSEQFNLENPDEHRLPWDHFGAEVWDLTKG
ncbi:MAG: dTDP-4-dehydrorhamnose 3,5-epimerase, partial [Candidatus Pacebacteria bacterium CG_4_10_14_0_8_um_filter_42_14]